MLKIGKQKSKEIAYSSIDIYDPSINKMSSVVEDGNIKDKDLSRKKKYYFILYILVSLFYLVISFSAFVLTGSGIVKDMIESSYIDRITLYGTIALIITGFLGRYIHIIPVFLSFIFGITAICCGQGIHLLLLDHLNGNALNFFVSIDCVIMAATFIILSVISIIKFPFIKIYRNTMIVVSALIVFIGFVCDSAYKYAAGYAFITVITLFIQYFAVKLTVKDIEEIYFSNISVKRKGWIYAFTASVSLLLIAPVSVCVYYPYLVLGKKKTFIRPGTASVNIKHMFN